MEALALSDQAKMKTGVEADELFKQAGQKYAAALEIKPDSHKALNNWGTTLLFHYRIVPKNKKEEMIQKSKALFKQAEKLISGYSAYNLACVYSILGKLEDCKYWLIKSNELGQLPSQNHLETDADLVNIRKTKWFNDFLNSLEQTIKKKE